MALVVGLPGASGARIVRAGGAARAAGPPVAVSETAPALHRELTSLRPLRFGSGAVPRGVPVVTVDDTVRLQRINGFGAAMTDSSAWLIERALSPARRAALMARLFGSGGLHLSFLRVPIGASDYTAGGVPYTYDDMPPGQSDPALAHFSIAHDRAWVLPALRAARALNPGLELLGTPWSAPGWMKGNGTLDNIGGRGTLRGAAWGPWADYLVRFLQAYARAGVPVDALTLQNEPGNPTHYPGMNLAAWAETKWLGQDLVPALARARLHPKLYGLDAGWASTSYALATVHSAAARDLSGLAWHCYYGSPNVMSSLHAQAPALETIVDECSPGISTIPPAEVVISSLRNWASTVALWNLALDPHYGPVQQPNTGCPRCYGLALINEGTGAARLLQPYFQLGQASRYIARGAVRVASNTEVSYDYTRPGANFISPGLDDVAVVDPDGTRVLLAYDNAPRPITFAVRWHGQSFVATLPARGTATFRWAGPS